MDVMMNGGLDGGVEDTSLLDKDSRSVVDGQMSREDPGQFNDVPDVELDITRKVSPSIGENGTARLRDTGMEDTLLDTDSLLDGQNKDMRQDPGQRVALSHVNTIHDMEPDTSTATPSIGVGDRARLRGGVVEDVLLDTNEQEELAAMKSVLGSQDTIEPDSSTPPEEREGLIDASQTTPSVGQISRLHSQPASLLQSAMQGRIM